MGDDEINRLWQIFLILFQRPKVTREEFAQMVRDYK